MIRRLIIASIAVLTVFIFKCDAQEVTKQRVKPIRENTAEQMKSPYMIFISADGFRYDYAEKYKAKNLLKQANEGVKATSMIPVFPSSTGPNHYSLVTGLYPVHNGIIGNSFYDPVRKKLKDGTNTWLKNDPIWISAEKQGMVTASLGFIGSKQKINGMQNSYYYEYGKPRIGMTERVEIIKKWLSLPEKVRPHFIAVYNNETDHAGHGFGPDSKETEEAVGEIDSFIAQLQVAIEESGLPVNVVFVSDHGMTSIKQDHPIKTPSSIDTTKYIVVDHRALLSVHAKEREDIMPLYNKLKAEKSPYYTVFLQKDLPKELHFDMKEDKYNRIGDIILLAKWPGLFSKSPKGSHGFNPYEIKDMHATFYAWGPAFKKNLTIESFPTVDLYDMVMKALRLKPETNDGTGALAEQVLK
jgi:predicted AlkP superfamily pyrophosphatase or phosphodiesterase